MEEQIFKEVALPARTFYVDFLTKYANQSYFESIARQPIIRRGGKEELTTAADEIDSLAQDLVLLKQDLFKAIPETKINQEFARKTRLKMEKAFNIKPIAEFGTNYAEHYRDGVGAIEKILLERNGQVAGAFWRKELGDIDLVWGDSSFGLAHILQERIKQWGEEKALRFISHLSENIQKGHIVEVEKGRIGIKTELTTIILDKKDGNNFVITAFRDSGNKKELESLNLIQSKALTSENAGTNAKESPVTSLNQESIIPQPSQEKPKWSKADQRAWKAQKLAETKAKAKELQEKVQAVYNEARPLIIEAHKIKATKNLEKDTKAKEKYDALYKQARQQSTTKLEPLKADLEKHNLAIDDYSFWRDPEYGSIKIKLTHDKSFNLEWNAKKRGEQGAKGSAKYRQEALQKLSEKRYIDRLEAATTAKNPLTQLHSLKYEILKDLNKARLYERGLDYDHTEYMRYINRAGDELGIIDQAIRELKNSIVPKPQRVEQVRNKVQDFIKWRDEVRFDTDYLITLESDGIKHALEYLEKQLESATLPQQRNFIHQLKEQIQEYFTTPPTPPSTPTPPTQKGLFDEVDSSVESTPPKDTLESTPPKVDSNPTPSQPHQAQKLKEALQIPLTDDRGLQSLAFGRVGSDAEIMEQVLIPQARNAYRKGTSQNKLEVAARNTLKKHRQDLEQSLNITPIKEFGTNYAEHYHSGESAIQKLLLERNGQVSGAFYRKELGDIDLVWGEVTGKGKEAKGWGLAKIIEKHLNAGDFKAFGEGEAGLINAINEIIQDGKVVTQNGVSTIWYKKDENIYKLGISKGFHKKGDNNWIITSYKAEREKDKTFGDALFTDKHPLPNSSEIIPQQTQKSLFDTQEPTPQKVDSSVESHTKHQDYNTFNQSLKDAHDFFKANNKDAYNDKLFDDVIKVANALDIRFWYQPNAVYMAGSYTYRLNRIMLQSDNFSKENANTMLHELIHSVTSRAIYAYDNKALREKLSEKQIEAITELKNLYKEVSENNADKVWQKMATFKDELENNKEGKLYGLKNEHEMLAELANPSFREFLKEQNIFSKIIEAMAKIFSYVKDKLTGESIKSTNAQSELETILYKIMDNYTNPHAFTNEMSEHFGSRNFVDTARYKEYIKDHKQKFDKDNGKSMFSFFDKMNHTTKNALSGRNSFIRHFLIRADFNDKDTKLVDEIRAKWTNANTRPENLIDLKTAENAHIFQAAAQAQENNIKDFVKEYYGVSYDEFNNAFNGAMKDKHFYEAKDWKRLGAFNNIPSKETAFLLALKPYFTSGLYKLLNEADFNVIKDSLYRILQDENLTYRNKPINEWFAKEWVEQDVKALQESFQYKLEQPQGQKGDDLTLFHRDLNINFNAPMKEIKPQLLAALKPIFNQTMTSADGKVKAYMSLKSLSKMTSDKAIQKSVDNGFSREQHLQAVLDIERLFENAKLAETHGDNKNLSENVLIHRLNSEIENANALITTKESLDINKNRIYSVELELTPRFNTSTRPTDIEAGKGDFSSQKHTADQSVATIAKTDGQSIAQDSNALLESTMKKFNYDGRKAKDLLEWHKDSRPLTKDENGVPKVFYHGTSADELFEVFSPRKDSTKWGFWFASGEDYADHYGKGKYGARQEPLKFSTFLKVKNPFDMTDDKNLEVLKKIMGKKEYEDAAKEVDFDHDNGASKIYRILSYSPFDRYKDKARAFQNKLKKLGYDGIKEQDGVMIVFEPNQIKHIENRGVAGQYFYSSSPNIFHSNPHAGAGLLGGSVAGVEQDENGNLTFSPEKFALGLLGGTGGSIAISKAKNTLKSTQNAVSLEKAQGQSKEMQQQLQSTIQTHLENLPPSPTPQPINEAKIKALIKRFDNIENLQEHLNTRADTKARQEIFSLLDDTLQTPQVHYKKDGKDKYLKRYKSERKEPYFYLLVTKDEDKTFITHFKTRDSKYLSKEITKAQEIIQGADIIEALSQRTGDI